MLSSKNKWCKKLPKVHGVQKELDPNLRPEKQHAISKEGKFERLQMDQGRADQGEENLIPSTRL